MFYHEEHDLESGEKHIRPLNLAVHTMTSKTITTRTVMLRVIMALTALPLVPLLSGPTSDSSTSESAEVVEEKIEVVCDGMFVDVLKVVILLVVVKAVVVVKERECDDVTCVHSHMPPHSMLQYREQRARKKGSLSLGARQNAYSSLHE